MESKARKPGSAAPIGACVVLGWLAHDVMKFLFGRSPLDGLPLLLPSIALVGLAALAAHLMGRSRKLTAAALVAAIGFFLAQYRLNFGAGPQAVWLPRVILLLFGAGLFARLAGHLQLSATRFALTLGAMGCVLVCWHRSDYGPASKLILIASSCGLLAGFLPWRLPRWVVTALCLLIPLGIGVSHTLRVGGIRRPPLKRPISVQVDAPNLVLIVLDTVRADHLAPYGYERSTTPALDDFVNTRCIRYDQARSTGNYTLPSHASMFTGLFPSEHGADHPRLPPREAGETVRHLNIGPTHGLRKDVPTLAEALRARGYRTGGVVANNAYLHSAYGLDRGFEHWDDRDPAWLVDYLSLVQFTGLWLRVGHIPYRGGEAITKAALEWIHSLRDAPVDPLGKGQRPFFLMLNYMDAHSPYFPSRAHRTAFGAEQPPNPLNPEAELFSLLYDRCLLDLDVHVDAFLDGLAYDGLLDDTVVIITSDHGEAFAEHGNYNHSWTLYEELVRVPLYVKPAGSMEASATSEPFRGVDLPGLALEQLGLGAWPPRHSPGIPTTPEGLGTAPGRNTLTSEWYPNMGMDPKARERWVAISGRGSDTDLIAWYQDGRKWIVGSDGIVEVFDLSGDRGETSPLELSDEVRQAALQRAEAWWEANPPLASQAQGPDLDAEHMQRLRGLGYTGDE